jgi:uncharacterized protein (TIGR03435 family)
LKNAQKNKSELKQITAVSTRRRSLIRPGGQMRQDITLQVFLIATIAIPVFSQTPSTTSFGVVSVKTSNAGGARNTSIGAVGGRFVATNVTIKGLLRYAYRSRTTDLTNAQLVGGPAWVDTDRFDVEAKPEGDSRPIPLEQMQQMVQSLLQDRFQLKIRRETREMPVYNLVTVKSEKLKLSEDQSPPVPGAGQQPPNASTPPRGAARMAVGGSGGTLEATAIGMAQLASSLQVQVDRPIIDKTNLPGLFDIHLQFAPESSSPVGGPQQAAPVLPSDPPGPSLFTAIQEQLGLKLESGKGPVAVIVIDRVQKPKEN